MTQTAKRSPFTMNVDLMHGPIFKSLVVFMLPIFVSNLFQQLYNTVDTMIVGNVLGDTALAAIGSCGSIYELLVGFGLGIGNGLAIVAARSYGAQDHDLLKKTVAGSLVIGLIASLCITLAGAVGLRPLLVLLDTPAEILEDAYRYIIVINYGVLVMFAYNLCAGLLRAIGNSFMPLVFLLLSSGLNILLDLLFIARMGMGVQGAAVATVISQGVSVLLCIVYVFAKVKLLLPEKKHFRVGRHLYWELFSQSICMGLMSSIVSAGSVVLQYGINGLGTLVIAGHTAARKMFMFTDMPLLSMASAARPKIANYHFTTLVPNLGVVSVGEEQNFVMADIPGIIEGASEGAGLGHDFLRHIDRCRLLLHLVDAAGSEGRDPIDDIEKINAELAGYSEFLAARPQIIVANKTDLLGEDREPVEKLRKYAEEHGFLFAELSAATNQGVRELMNLTWHELQQLPPVFVYEPEFVETEAAPVTENDWTIERDGDAYVVTGAWVDKVMGSVNLDDYESRQYMDRMLQTAGIYAKLEEMGIEENAPVIIGELEFEYVY